MQQELSYHSKRWNLMLSRYTLAPAKPSDAARAPDDHTRNEKHAAMPTTRQWSVDADAWKTPQQQRAQRHRNEDSLTAASLINGAKRAGRTFRGPSESAQEIEFQRAQRQRRRKSADSSPHIDDML